MPLPIHKHRKTYTYTQILNIHALIGIRTHDPGFRASEDIAWLRPLGYRDRPWNIIRMIKSRKMIWARHWRNHTFMKSLVVESEMLKPLGRLKFRSKYNIKMCLIEEQSNNFLLVFAGTVILGFETHDHIFIRSKTTYVFWNWASSSKRRGICLLLSNMWLSLVAKWWWLD
jgi:hypothetical protein